MVAVTETSTSTKPAASRTSRVIAHLHARTPGARSWKPLSEETSTGAAGNEAERGEPKGKSFLMTEARFFFSKGVPLSLASIMQWGVPPTINLFIAGATEDSAKLQLAMGYGRLFSNCTFVMIMAGLGQYIGSVIPGCIGAGRKDRIPNYFWRSMLMCAMILAPFMILQFFAGPLAQAIGVDQEIATEVGVYCRTRALMFFFIVPYWHLDSCFVNLGYARLSPLNAFFCGFIVNVSAFYLLVLKWKWGAHGAALAQVISRACGVMFWLLLMWYHGLRKTILGPSPTKERLLSLKELRVFLSLTAPRIVANFGGWFVFELQLLATTNIKGIAQPALAAAAVWIQCETAMAASQDGWFRATQMRALALLGQGSPHAKRAFATNIGLATACVALLNVVLLACTDALSGIVSNDADVRAAFSQIAWVLVPHMQTRIVALTAMSLLIPLGHWSVHISSVYVVFYLIVTPLVGVIALTDLVTTSARLKLLACVGGVPMGSTIMIVVAVTFMARLDWEKASKTVRDRANTDKK